MKFCIQKLLLSLRVVLMLFFLSSTHSINAQPYPNSSHPRIWLDSERLTILQEAYQNNTQEWQDFEGFLDRHLTTFDPYWQVSWAFMDGLAAFALAYQVTGNSIYADRALFFMAEFENRYNTLGANQDFYNMSYQIFGLGYDWLYDYAGFTVTLKTQYVQLMNAIYQYAIDPNQGAFQIDSADSDRFVGNAETHFIWGAATYGDNAMAAEMMDTARYMYVQYIDSYIDHAIGGIWMEGSQYSWATLSRLMDWAEAERTSTGYILLQGEREEIIPNTILGLIYLTLPDDKRILVYNDDEQSDSWDFAQTINFAAIASNLSTPYEDENRYVHHWLKSVNPPTNQFPEWDQFSWFVFLWYQPDSNISVSINNELATNHFFDGLNWSITRSDWTDSCTYTTFNANYTKIDHQQADAGHFNIWRNGQYLTKGTRHYDFGYQYAGVIDPVQRNDGILFNQLLIESDYEYTDPWTATTNRMGSQFIFSSDGDALIEKKYAERDSLVYLSADLTQAYNTTDPWNIPGLSSNRVMSYTRKFVHFSDDYFITLDRVKTVDTGWFSYVLHSLDSPIINDKTITQKSIDQAQKLFAKTLFPGTITFDITSEKDLFIDADTASDVSGLHPDLNWCIQENNKKWFTEVKPAETDELILLQVMETADSSKLTMVDAELINESNIMGCEVNSHVFIFSIDELPLDTVEYVRNSNGVMRHVVTDLRQDTFYGIYVNGIKLICKQMDASGVLVFNTNNNGVLNISVVKESVCCTKQFVDSEIYFRSDFSEVIADDKLTSSSFLNRGSNLILRSAQEVELKPGFHVKKGAIFEANIESCP